MWPVDGWDYSSQTRSVCVEGLVSNVHAPLTLPSLSLLRLYRIDAYLIRHVAELNPCGPLMGGTILVKQGQFVLSGRCAMSMEYWLRPLSLPRLYGIDAYLIRHIPL